MNLKGIKLTWLGHAAFRIETPEGKRLYVDPWIAGNPKCPENEKNVQRADVLICTHGHFDHIADAVDVAKKHDSVAVGIYELCAWLEKKGVKQTAPMNKGGTQTVADCQNHDGARGALLRHSGRRPDWCTAVKRAAMCSSSRMA